MRFGPSGNSLYSHCNFHDRTHSLALQFFTMQQLVLSHALISLCSDLLQFSYSSIVGFLSHTLFRSSTPCHKSKREAGQNEINLRRLKPFGMEDNECVLKSSHYTLHIYSASVCTWRSCRLVGLCLKEWARERERERERRAEEIEYDCST